MPNGIIQWNCRGLRNKIDDIQILIKEHNPIALCIQETLLKQDESLSIKNYTNYNLTPPIINCKVSGGVCVLVRNDIPHTEIQLNTSLQARAIQLTAEKQIT